MEYETIALSKLNGVYTAIFNRPEERNSMTGQFMADLNKMLDDAENDSACKVVIFAGTGGFFSTGMDFNEASESGFVDDIEVVKKGKKVYSDTIKRISLFPKYIISKVDGQVMAGGIGIIAASDLVLSTPRSQFSLSEAIWGLLPCMVMPYLIRRVGFQNAYRMTLTTIPVDVEKALSMNLVDDAEEKIDNLLRKYLLRIMRLSGKTITVAKEYFRKLWIINEEMEQLAIDQIATLEFDPEVRNNINNFIKYNKFPWEK